MRILDCFSHFMPISYYDFAKKNIAAVPKMMDRAANIPLMSDLDARSALVRSVEGFSQLLSTVSPTVDSIAVPKAAAELAAAYNDGLSEISERENICFPGFIASLAFTNPDAAVKEIERQNGNNLCLGFQIFSNINGAPLDKEDFEPIFAALNAANKPVLLHPTRGYDFSDYKTEEFSQFEIWWSLGWPYETSAAMFRLVLSGILERYPNLKIITHHGGGFIPAAGGRIDNGLPDIGSRTPKDFVENVRLKGSLQQAMRSFYADTAGFGSTIPVIGAVEFFGSKKVVFATDCPFGAEGKTQIENTLNGVLNSGFSKELEADILYNNAAQLFGI